MTLAAREEACLASMKIASPIFRNYEGSTCIVRSTCTIRKGDEITDNYGLFYQILAKEESKDTLSKQYFFDLKNNKTSFGGILAKIHKRAHHFALVSIDLSHKSDYLGIYYLLAANHS